MKVPGAKADCPTIPTLHGSAANHAAGCYTLSSYCSCLHSARAFLLTDIKAISPWSLVHLHSSLEIKKCCESSRLCRNTSGLVSRIRPEPSPSIAAVSFYLDLPRLPRNSSVPTLAMDILEKEDGCQKLRDVGIVNLIISM